MSEEDLEHLIINQLQESSLLFVQCLWDLMKVGIKFNSIYPILQEEPMVQTTSRRYEFKSMQIAEYAESISPTGMKVMDWWHQWWGGSDRYLSYPDIYPIFLDRIGSPIQSSKSGSDRIGLANFLSPIHIQVLLLFHIFCNINFTKTQGNFQLFSKFP